MKRCALFVSLCFLFLGGSVVAGPFPPNVANDVYGVAQGGVVNGIPTANDLNDGVPDIFDAINLIQGSALTRNVGADPLDDILQFQGHGNALRPQTSGSTLWRAPEDIARGYCFSVQRLISSS